MGLIRLLGHLCFEWYVLGAAPRTDTTKCSKEIGLYAQNMITILGSIVNIIGSTRIYTSAMNEILILDLKVMRKVATALIWMLSNSN